jgi:hypothetical protein
VSFKLSAGGVAVASFSSSRDTSQPDRRNAADAGLQYAKTHPAHRPRRDGERRSVVPQELSFDMGYKLAMPPSMNATDGYGEVQIIDRRVTGFITTDAELASVIDYDTLLSAGTLFTITTGVIGATAGNRLTLSTARATQAYFTNRQFVEGDGARRRTMPFGVADHPRRTANCRWRSR